MTASNVQIRKGINTDSIDRDEAYKEIFKEYIKQYPWLDTAS
jgi:hypothetical protein